MGVPKRILITAVRDDRSDKSTIVAPQHWNLKTEMEVDDVADSAASSSSPPVRKRQRLDHLTREEKIMRRKLKNRVAAQSARDRKKARMDELEEQVTVLQAERNALVAENKILRKRLQQCEEEKLRLNQRLQSQPSSPPAVIAKPVKTEPLQPASPAESVASSGAIEYASLISGPLQKDQVLLLTLALWMTQYGFWHLMMSVMTSLHSYKSAAKTFLSCPSPMTALLFLYLLKRGDKPESRLVENGHPQRVWWGPHQRSWTPSKN